VSQKLYLSITGFVFLLVGVFHLLRLVYHWPIIVGPRTIPYALSFIGCPVSLGYSVWAAWLLRAGMVGGHHPTPSSMP
jgi:hypothetical protein